MSRRQKIAVIAVLAALVLLYSGALANGGRTGQGSPDDRNGGFVGWLGGLVGQPPAVARADLSADCLNGDTLTVDGRCVLHVAGSDTDTRRVGLHARDAATVTSRAPRGDQLVHADVKAGDDLKVTVDGKGGDITLDCADAGSTCVLSLT